MAAIEQWAARQLRCEQHDKSSTRLIELGSYDDLLRRILRVHACTTPRRLNATLGHLWLITCRGPGAKRPRETAAISIQRRTSGTLTSAIAQGLKAFILEVMG